MIGIDIVSISKFIDKSKSEYFIKRIFTENELLYAYSKTDINKTLAGIFAAKEATVKAFNLNLAYILRKKIEILHINSIPVLSINQSIINSDLSISHDEDYAIAICYKKNDDINKKIDEKMQKIFPQREKVSHKGDYGKIGILGGSSGMAGSVFMSSMASMRAGAGLSYIIAPQSISKILQIKANEQIIKEINCKNFYYNNEISNQILDEVKNLDVLIIGPGMGKGNNLNELINEIIKNINMPVLIDADGLNAVSKDLSILNTDNNIILKPHIGEFSRLTGLSIEEIKKDKIKLAEKFARDNSLILVLKSDETIVTDGENTYINKIGNPGMATAGSGDVLTGIIAALINRIDIYDAAKLGVYLHSLAGDIAKEKFGEDSLISTDIIDCLPYAIKRLRNL